jgi:hypothetical protein
MNATVSAPGNSGVWAANWARKARWAWWSWRTCPWVNDRRKVPNVEGTRVPLNAMSMPPWRNRSASSMLSAPATMAATSDVTFAAGLAPPLLSAPTIRIASSTNSGRPHRWASRRTGTRPASAIRFGSSNRADTVEAVCKNLTW